MIFGLKAIQSIKEQKPVGGVKKKRCCYPNIVYAHKCVCVCVCVCSHSTVLFVLGGGRWACILQKEFDALRSPRNPSLPFCPSHFPDRIVLFLSEERDLPIEKHGLCGEHLTQRLTTNTGKWQRSTPLVLSRYNAYMHKSFPSHVFLEINIRMNHYERLMGYRQHLRCNRKNKGL